jgi:hypothetical protein
MQFFARRARDLRRRLIGAVLAWNPAHATTAADYRPLGEEIVAHVREHFLDAQRAQAWAEKHSRYGAAAKTAADFERLTSLALKELGKSHTAYYPKDSSENLRLRSLYASVIKEAAARDRERRRELLTGLPSGDPLTQRPRRHTRSG